MIMKQAAAVLLAYALLVTTAAVLRSLEPPFFRGAMVTAIEAMPLSHPGR